ncbi:MAG: Gfo/Idh/MocA family oxidoreductase [Bryobacteraceae bacterium]
MQIPPRIAVIGCGGWGRNLVRNFSQLGVLEMVCDPSETARAVAAQLNPGVRVVADLSEVLGSNVSGIVIATPAETHFDVATSGLMAGKDVFVEKPLALTYDQGLRLTELAERQKRVLMVGHVLEYHPGILRLLEIVHSGALGNLFYIYSHRLSLGKVRREENILWSFAPHDVAVMLRLVGRMPSTVTACGGNYIRPHIADVTVTQFLFDSYIRGHIHVSWLHPFKEQRLVVICSRKMASFDDTAKRLVVYDRRVEVQEGQSILFAGNGEEISYPPDEPLLLECQAFLNAMLTRQPPLTDGYSGARVLRVLEAAQQSLIGNGEPVAVENGLYRCGGATAI